MIDAFVAVFGWTILMVFSFASPVLLLLAALLFWHKRKHKVKEPEMSSASESNHPST
jgi:hypothetical protein